MKNITEILVAFFVVATASLYAQTNVTASFGSAFAGSDGSTFADGEGNVFSASNPGVLAFGWSDGFDDQSSNSGMIEDFNMLEAEFRAHGRTIRSAHGSATRDMSLGALQGALI